MYAQRHVVDIITSTAGVGEGYTPVVTGRVLEVGYAPSTTVFTSTFDLAVVGEDSGKNILTKADIGLSAAAFCPTQPVHTQAGVALDLTTGGGAPAFGPIVVANERVKITVTSGGDSKEGSFVVVVA